MKLTLIYPRWPKLSGQTEFHLPPHGPVVFAAALPAEVQVEFIDENLEAIDFDAATDAVAISMMLTAQVQRGWEIADIYRARGVPGGGCTPASDLLVRRLAPRPCSAHAAPSSPPERPLLLPTNQMIARQGPSAGL